MKDRETRDAVASLLITGDPLQIGTLRLWADLIGDPWPCLPAYYL